LLDADDRDGSARAHQPQREIDCRVTADDFDNTVELGPWYLL